MKMRREESEEGGIGWITPPSSPSGTLSGHQAQVVSGEGSHLHS